MISRRRFAAGAATIAFLHTAGRDAAAASRIAVAARSGAGSCADGLPPWVAPLRTDLERMARELTARLHAWHGPGLVLQPEAFGHRQGDALSTRAIQAAIDAAALRGGGTVRLANGDYVSGTLDLRSNIRLEVVKGARLLGSVRLADYPARPAAHRTMMDVVTAVTQSLIFAQGCRNIGLGGEGLIDGRGSQRNFPGQESSTGLPGRPFLIRVLDCNGVHVQGLHLKDSAAWMQNYLNCGDLLIERIHVQNQANYNNDGLDIDGCRRVIVRDCLINSEDDGICFKGSSRRRTEDVLVENCAIYSTSNALKFGTDSEASFRRVLARNLELGGPGAGMPAIKRRRAESGISWESVDGGAVEDVLASNINIVRAQSPIFLRLGDRGRTFPGQRPPGPGKLRRIVFDRISGGENGPRGSYFLGMPDHPIEDVAIRDLQLKVDAARGPAPDERAVSEFQGVYPDAGMIGELAPAYGLWTRHVRNLTLERVAFVPTSPDSRPMIETLDTTQLCSKTA
ncbi:MAG: glycoside hydrolase family 28 protein [Steroidobacteraceae bacterium]